MLAAYLMKEEAGLKSVTDELMTRKGRVRVRAALNFLLRRRGPITTTGCDHGALVSTRGVVVRYSDSPSHSLDGTLDLRSGCRSWGAA